MSTKFTTLPSDPPLTVLLHDAGQHVMRHLISRLGAEFPEIGAAHLTFFGALDCGVSHASAVAVRLGISRQAVSRTARDLEAMGLLVLQPDQERLNHNQLVMTEKGEALAMAGRAALVEVEARLGAEDAQMLRSLLARLRSPGK